MSEKNEWKLVPVIATDEMEAAAEDDYEQTGATFPRWKSAYAAMLAAAPSPASVAPGDAQDERQAFEAWMASRNLGLLRDGDSYSLTYARRAWEAWQARASVAAPAAGDALDAARYRWLREKAHQTAGRAPAAVLCDESDMFQRGESGSESGFIHGKDLDDAIDAALAAQVPQQGEA